jgi:hypothetical protein
MPDFPGCPEKVQPETIDLIAAQVNDQVSDQVDHRGHVDGRKYRVGV